MTSPPSDERQELLRFGQKAESVFNRLTHGGRPVKVGDFLIELVEHVGIWVYFTPGANRQLIYSYNLSNMHANFGDSDMAKKARDQFLRYLILEELADV